MKAFMFATVAASVIAVTSSVSAQEVVRRPLQPSIRRVEYTNGLGVRGTQYWYSAHIQDGEYYFNPAQFVSWFQHESVRQQLSHGATEQTAVTPTRQEVLDRVPGMVRYDCVIPSNVPLPPRVRQRHLGWVLSGNAETASANDVFAGVASVSMTRIYTNMRNRFGAAFIGENEFITTAVAERACRAKIEHLGVDVSTLPATVTRLNIRGASAYVFVPWSVAPTGRQNAEAALREMRTDAANPNLTLRDQIGHAIDQSGTVLDSAVLRNIPPSIDPRGDVQRAAQARAQVDPATNEQLAATVLNLRTVLSRAQETLPAQPANGQPVALLNPDAPLGAARVQTATGTEPVRVQAGRNVGALAEAERSRLEARVREAEAARDHAIQDRDEARRRGHSSSGSSTLSFWNWFTIGALVFFGLAMALLALVVAKSDKLRSFVSEWLKERAVRKSNYQQVAEKARLYDEVNNISAVCKKRIVGFAHLSVEDIAQREHLDTDDVRKYFPMAIQIEGMMREEINAITGSAEATSVLVKFDPTADGVMGYMLRCEERAARKAVEAYKKTQPKPETPKPVVQQADPIVTEIQSKWDKDVWGEFRLVSLIDALRRGTVAEKYGSIALTDVMLRRWTPVFTVAYGQLQVDPEKPMNILNVERMMLDVEIWLKKEQERKKFAGEAKTMLKLSQPNMDALNLITPGTCSKEQVWPLLTVEAKQLIEGEADARVRAEYEQKLAGQKRGAKFLLRETENNLSVEYARLAEEAERDYERKRDAAVAVARQEGEAAGRKVAEADCRSFAERLYGDLIEPLGNLNVAYSTLAKMPNASDETRMLHLSIAQLEKGRRALEDRYVGLFAVSASVMPPALDDSTPEDTKEVIVQGEATIVAEQQPKPLQTFRETLRPFGPFAPVDAEATQVTSLQALAQVAGVALDESEHTAAPKANGGPKLTPSGVHRFETILTSTETVEPKKMPEEGVFEGDDDTQSFLRAGISPKDASIGKPGDQANGDGKVIGKTVPPPPPPDTPSQEQVPAAIEVGTGKSDTWDIN